MANSRAYTAEEIREISLDCLDGDVKFWKQVDGYSDEDKLRGLVHSVLCLIDGVAGKFPAALYLHASAHPEDEENCKAEGVNLVEQDTILNPGDSGHD